MAYCAMSHFLNIRSQWLGPEILIFCDKSILRKIRSHADTIVPKFRSDLSARLKDTAEKQVPAKLKTMAGNGLAFNSQHYIWWDGKS